MQSLALPQAAAIVSGQKTRLHYLDWLRVIAILAVYCVHVSDVFNTVNFDFLQHYRPMVNVVERPHAGAGGRGFAITGHHELMLPLLAAILIELDA